MIHAWPMWNAHLEPGRHVLANAGEFIRCHPVDFQRQITLTPAPSAPPAYCAWVTSSARCAAIDVPGGALHTGNTFLETVMTCRIRPCATTL
jgi:hypothetical protein